MLYDTTPSSRQEVIVYTRVSYGGRTGHAVIIHSASVSRSTPEYYSIYARMYNHRVIMSSLRSRDSSTEYCSIISTTVVVCMIHIIC